MQIIKWDKIGTAIETAKDIQTLTMLKNKLRAYQILAEQSKQSVDVQAKIAIYKARADRKCGEWLKENVEHGGQNKKARSDVVTSLKEYKSISSSVEPSIRMDNLTFAHHQQVAPLEPEEQKEWLCKASENKWSVRELKSELHKDKIEKKYSKSSAFPKGKYHVIYADPPWDVKAGPGWGTSEESRELEYPTMTIDQIKFLVDKAGKSVKELFLKDSHLYFWTINKYIYESYEIIREWGFEPSCMLTWCKPPHGIGLGGTFVQTTERFLFKKGLQAWKNFQISMK